MNLIEKSLEIALKAYLGQRDKAGETYILHPLRIMAKMQTEEEMSVALLHDVIEDSDYTAEDLLEEGIPSEIVEAISILSKSENDSYEAFINKVTTNRLARKIKKADIEDNINILRLKTVSEKDLQRIVKYHKAWKQLDPID